VQRTLFVIPVPDELFGLPVVGFGWLLILWGILAAVWSAVLLRRPDGSKDLMGHLPLFLVVAAAIIYVLPILRMVEGTQVGFPVRGYGVMLVLAIVSSVGLAAHRALRMGVNPEAIYTLAMVLIVCGVAGARTFFVLQYWDTFYVPGDWGATFSKIFRVTEGGIVVYGALIGAAVAFAAYCIRTKIPALALADLIAPSLLLGMFFGRIGCFMNGCCYGGLCAVPTLAVHFPQGIPPQYTPPYVRHMENGAFYGALLGTDEEGIVRVTSVLPNSPASKYAEIEVGDVVTHIHVPSSQQKVFELQGQVDDVTQKKIPPMDVVQYALLRSWSSVDSPAGDISLRIEDKQTYRLIQQKLPQQSLGVHPTQVYSSANGLILCLMVLAYYPFRKHDGEVIALTLGLYSITRFLLEVIRTDEYAIGGTGLTISQNVSIVILISAVALWFAVRLLKKPLAWPVQTA